MRIIGIKFIKKVTKIHVGRFCSHVVLETDYYWFGWWYKTTRNTIVIKKCTQDVF